MFLKRRQIAIILSVIYLGALTVLAAYASHAAHEYSLPIPNALSSLALALPPIAGITIETSNALATALSTSPKHRKADVSTIPPILLPSTITVAMLLIYETVIATLAGTYISPTSGLACALHDKWQELFKTKNARRIKVIQDAFRCCGLRNRKDMAWPFPSKEAGSDACFAEYGRDRDQGCFDAWQSQERMIAGLMLVVAIGVFVWMMVVIAVPVAQPKPLRGILQLPAPDEDVYSQRYRDDADAGNEDDDNDDATSVRREINKLNSQSSLAGLIESQRTRSSALINDSNRWRDD